MQTVYAVMLVLGCSHDVKIYEPTELINPYYPSIKECEADISAQEHFSGEYPLTIVQCLDVESLPADSLVKIQWYFDQEGLLIAKAGLITDPLLKDEPPDVELALKK